MYALLPQGLVLEIGPGIGGFAKECTAMNYSYVGVEFNWRLLRRLTEKYRLVRSLVPPLPIKNESVPVVVVDQVVEHMPTFREALILLSECHRALKPSGFLVLGFPDYIRTGLVFYDRDYSHSFLTTENRVEQILRDAGFESVKIARFRGSISTLFPRLLLDLIMLSIYSKLACFIANALGVSKLLGKIRKTLPATTVIFAQKHTAQEE